MRVAVKDLIAVRGLPRSLGNRDVLDVAAPEPEDAECLAALRHSESVGEAQFVGTVQLHEFALGATGVNHWFGTPVNPSHHELIPGGSSSGSAVAVASGAADISFATDTGGSIRIPAACCGVYGVMATAGTLPMGGVHPVSPSLDRLGVIARSVDDLSMGLRLLNPTFSGPESVDGVVLGRFAIDADPRIDAAVDLVLAGLDLTVRQMRLGSWELAQSANRALLCLEAANSYRWLRDPEHGVRWGKDIERVFREGSVTSKSHRVRIAEIQQRWAREIDEAFELCDVLVLPTLLGEVPTLENADDMYKIRATSPINLAGLPSIAVPISWSGRGPASIQLVGRPMSEGLLLGLAARIEQNSR